MALLGSEGVRKLVSGGCDSTVKVWKLSNGVWTREGGALTMHSDWVRDVAWSPSLGKSIIASASQDGTVVIWSLKKDGDNGRGKF
ncbi:hypothetical protein GIB67_041051 [Kingdonia uniflora]|uniref:Sec13-like protein n=1 Tax=Kingdonia uniflora TaxID=39325 RepID=A0A7J7LSD8_9MAGN|nr:hypothetical protein GIB67_041051 [Kingdonia uniflora]